MTVFKGWALLAAVAAGMAAQPAVSGSPRGEGDSGSPFDGVPNLTFSHYDISGTSAAALNAAIDRYGPRDGDGGNASGRTNYRIGFTWAEQGHGASCEVTDVKVQFTVDVTLPRLADETALSPAMRAEWRRFMAVLRVHEAGHAHIAYNHVDEVKAAVAASRCGEERMRGREALDRIDRLQADYDRRTDGGERQGNIVI